MYKPGDAQITDDAISDARDDDAFETPRRERPATIYLPHSCDDWVIGGPAEAWALIADLKELIAEYERKWRA